MYMIEELINRGEIQNEKNISKILDFIKNGLQIKTLNKMGVFITETCFMNFNKKKQLVENLFE